MAVALDVLFTGGNSGDGDCQEASAATSFSFTGPTVTASATLLVVCVTWDHNVTSRTMTWNGTSMTEALYVNHSGHGSSAIWYLVSPASGAKTLAANWTTSADYYVGIVAFKGSDTSTPIVTADNTSGTTSVTTVTVTSTTDGATVAQWETDGSEPTINFNKIYGQADLNPGGGASYQLGGTSNAHTFTGAGGSFPAWCGVHIPAGAGGGGATLHQLPATGVGA